MRKIVLIFILFVFCSCDEANREEAKTSKQQQTWNSRIKEFNAPLDVLDSLKKIDSIKSLEAMENQMSPPQ